MNPTQTPQSPTRETSPWPRTFPGSVHAACRRIAPLWPLKNYVAVNPFMGFTGHTYLESAAWLGQIAGHQLLPPKKYYAKCHESGRITESDLRAALEEAADKYPGLDLSTRDLLDWTNRETEPAHRESRMHSVAGLADRLSGGGWTALVVEETAKWCAAYHDQGQSSWHMPWRNEGFYGAWRSGAMLDLAPELQGLPGFRSWVRNLPGNAAGAIAFIGEKLGVPPDSATDFYHLQLLDIAGWSSYIQYQVREKSMHGREDHSLCELLAVRLAYDLAVLELSGQPGLREAWESAFPIPKPGTGTAPSKDLLHAHVWQTALEKGFQKKMADDLKRASATLPGTTGSGPRPAVQAVFCIDVRSEPLRRSLESVRPGIQTLGFAGFFGIPMEYLPLGERHGSSQCPVLLLPRFRIRESLERDEPGRENNHIRNSIAARRLKQAWNGFKSSAVSCFSFVETFGLAYGGNLLIDGLNWKKNRLAFTRTPRTRPSLVCRPPGPHHGVATGISHEDQVNLAHGALKNMGLTSGFARLVLFCGHGSSTANNPYASGLDCGACGGHTGESNARVLAALLNTLSVRKDLEHRGINIPEDTWFLAGLHNTTTDDVTLFNLDAAPPTHSSDLASLADSMDAAAVRARQARAGSLGLGKTDPDLGEAIRLRSRDWAQVRPEWGLAGNAAFIAAPRERTAALDLKGRVFLHSYRHELDPDNSTLELIMTAPMVVAHWINLQYYASTVDNAHFGSGNKVLHNVVGTFGICQGNGGDLQTGLPIQSLHNGSGWVHEPLRLSVFIEAPIECLEKVLDKNPAVRELADHQWLHLFALGSGGRTVHQYQGPGFWAPR